jgi:bifunctional non-homologous end joining protein LigD
LQRLYVTESKARLHNILIAGSRFVRFTDHVIGNGPAVFAQADALDHEGIVTKRIASAYHPRGRTRDWLKVKSWRTRALTIGGVQFDHDGRLEAVLVGTAANGALRYEGRIELALGNLGKLRERLAIIAAHDCPFHGEWRESDRRVWLRPELSVEIRALPQRAGTLLRHATFVRAL